MNWDAISTIAEVAGAIGVILSLLYLALQIRNENRQTRLQAVNESARQWNEVLASTADNETLCKIWVNGLNDFDALSIEHKAQFSAHAGRILRVIEGMHEHNRQGQLRDEAWDAIERTVQDLMGYDGAQTWWATRARWYSKSFQQYIEEAISRSSGHPNAYGERD